MRLEWNSRFAAARGGAAQCASGFTLIELIVALVVIGLIAAIALPNYVKIKDKAREAEAKAGLHNIQTALERFAVDNNGNYPPYLIGGDNQALKIRYKEDDREDAELIETKLWLSPDMLLQFRYLDRYPSNPFISRTSAVQQLQAQVGDPLRSSRIDGRLVGTRFGADGKLMGQVLCDTRWPLRETWDRECDQSISLNNWVNIQYDFYDVWLNQLRRPYLPGSFFYKSIGEIMPYGNVGRDSTVIEIKGQKAMLPMDMRTAVVIPVSTTDYMLGVWGSIRTKGQDVLGEEPIIFYACRPTRIPRKGNSVIVHNSTGIYDLPAYVPQATYSLVGVPPWTRSVNKSHIGPLWGSPFGPGGDDGPQLEYGNPNGIRDAIILTLTAGKDSQ